MPSNNFVSHPFQKNITIHREKVENDFLCIKNENWKRANRDLTPFGLQLYLYFASNKDGYNFDLSAEHADRDANIKRTSFHNYINLMIQKGYLVKGKGNCYDFYEVPQPVNDTPADDEGINFEDDPTPVNSSDGFNF